MFGGHPADNLLLNNYLFAGKKKPSTLMGSGKSSVLTVIGMGKKKVKFVFSNIVQQAFENQQKTARRAREKLKCARNVFI